jgi:Antitoxin-like ribbon-helix-helix
MSKADLAALLAETSGSARHRKPAADQPAARKAKVQPQTGRGGTSPITVHFPKQVRDQLKILAVQNGTTLHSLVAEAFNDLFAKHGKPEIAPAHTQPSE